MTGKVVSFGEILFRIAPDPGQFTAAFSLGGAELNVATALATWGIDVAYVSRMPENVLAKNIDQILQGLSIDTSRMLWGGERIGIYYLQPGGDMQSQSVVYDRKWSAFSQLEPGTTDWNQYLEGAAWLHWTAITPALNENAVIICREILQAARKKNITISTDLNYRRLLWQYGKSPLEVMPELAAYCDVIMGNLWSAASMLGIEWNEGQLIRGDKVSCAKLAAEVAEKITSRFVQCRQVAFTFRFTMPDNSLQYFASLYSRQTLTLSKSFYRQSIADSVGSGDSFMAGLIYGMLHQLSEQEVIDFAAAAAVSKLNVQGDANTTPLNQVKALLS